MLNLEEVEKILSDVKADNVQVIPVPKHYDFADYMIVATGRSSWHVRNIAQALIYKAGSPPSYRYWTFPHLLDIFSYFKSRENFPY